MSDEFSEEELYNEKVLERRMQDRQQARTVRKKKIWSDRFRALIRFVLIIFLLLFSYKLMTCRFWFIGQEIFSSADNKSLFVTGNVIAPTYKVLNALRKIDLPNKPIYLINPKIFVDNIKNIPTVKRVFVRRFFLPARFLVYIEEKQPFLLISPDEKVEPIAAFLDDGTLIGREYMPIKQKNNTYLILSYGIKGDDYQQWESEKVKSIYVFAKNVENYLKEKIVYMDFRNPKDVFVKLQTTSLRVGEIDDDIYERISSVDGIFKEIKKLHKKIDYIDCRWKTKYLKLGSTTKVATPESVSQIDIEAKPEVKEEKPVETVNPENTNTNVNTNINETSQSED